MSEETEIKIIKADELSLMIGQDNLIVVDIRDQGSYQRGHIPGALSLKSDLDVKNFLDNGDRSKTVVCCCFHGISSQRAALYLQTQGFQDVRSLEGGFEYWKLEQKVEV